MTDRVYNFSPGPAVLPVPVLETVRDQMLALPGAGASILEISHRSKAFDQIHREAEARLRKLMGISDDYAVLYLQGGSRLQFAMVPMNLLAGKTGAYLVTGSWGAMAADEATKFGAVARPYTSKATNFDRLPAKGEYQIPQGAAYTYFVSNETIQGVQFPAEPDAGGAPLICDASSDFLCRPVDVSKYGLIYACAQKNAGPAGVTIVIIRRDLLERSQDALPSYLNYRQHVENDSLLNTPPTFAIYVNDLICQWLENDVGGLAAMKALNEKKAALLYDVIDRFPGFYQGHAQPGARSLMNVTFRLPGDALQEQFLARCKQEKLTELKGHRSVGGIRASIYNAMPVEGVQTLADVMTEFATENG